MWRATPPAAQHVTTTPSRRSQPRPWLRSVAWLIGAGLHPRATATTQRVAEDLAHRMDYTEGTVLYDLQGTARRVGISVATVKRHVSVLREAGLLAWQRHGTRRNLQLPGRKYTATATIYAATIPPTYDAAMGHRLSGAGYEARIIGVTDAGRKRSVDAARKAAAGREPHSRGRSRDLQKAEVSGGLKDTSRKRAIRSTASTSPNSSDAATRRNPPQVARDITIARQVRPLIVWTQTEKLRRLAFALRPLIDQGMGAHEIAAELSSWYLTWRPAQPAAYIAAQLKRHARRDAEIHPGIPAQDSPSWRAYREQQAAQVAQAEASHGDYATLESLTPDEITDLRSAAASDPALITTAIENLGMLDTQRLYGRRLVHRALLHVFRAEHMQLHA